VDPDNETKRIKYRVDGLDYEFALDLVPKHIVPDDNADVKLKCNDGKD